MIFPLLPRHPILRLLVLVAGAVLLIGLLTVGFVLGGIVLAAVALTLAFRRWLAHGRRGPHEPDIIEGEFTVEASRARTSLPHIE
jgi:hypothetical protein